MNEKLSLLSLAHKFTITPKKESWLVDSEDDIAAQIFNNGEVNYFITGCYNSGTDWLRIDTGALEDMKKFCRLMAGDDYHEGECY